MVRPFGSDAFQATLRHTCICSNDELVRPLLQVCCELWFAENAAYCLISGESSMAKRSLFACQALRPIKTYCFSIGSSPNIYRQHPACSCSSSRSSCAPWLSWSPYSPALNLIIFLLSPAPTVSKLCNSDFEMPLAGHHMKSSSLSSACCSQETSSCSSPHASPNTLFDSNYAVSIFLSADWPTLTLVLLWYISFAALISWRYHPVCFAVWDLWIYIFLWVVFVLRVAFRGSCSFQCSFGGLWCFLGLAPGCGRLEKGRICCWSRCWRLRCCLGFCCCRSCCYSWRSFWSHTYHVFVVLLFESLLLNIVHDLIGRNLLLWNQRREYRWPPLLEEG